MSGTTLEWFGATTFRLKTRGLTIFLDTWLEKPDVLPHYLSIDQVTEADYIFISHAHFDHLPGCDRLAKQTGAIVIANGEAINTLREAGVSEDQLIPVAGGERIPLFTKATRLAALEDEVATAPGPPGAPRRPEDSLATMAVHAVSIPRKSCKLNPDKSQWPSLHCVLPGKSHADIPDEMNTATRYEGSSPYACTIDITIGMRYGLLRLSELVSPENLDQGERSFADYVSKRDVNIMSHLSLTFKDVLIQAIAGRANIDGRPYDGSAAEAATMISELLGQPQQIIWCLHDEAPIKPWRIDTRAATSMVESKTKSRVLELTPGEAQYLFDV
ncbi:hypothetical protein E4T38_09626 [Aureobasidium subglaciale]|nr:hypothetical protein E4T38_09626 [Aureobasidium subglaciale]KAI5213644.1 hypothetical protein E4T40_09568 [Aureobasidium subglaciale]KAI5215381.1 hypothetical protein E4T41_09606 [Aureobasidium subglaciale]KAI5253295.1 hypothetical protein E4T46_09583 [Aureobasidium subglaciale]